MSEELSRYPMTQKVCDQLYSAVGSIEANIADGYSRSSGKDRCRFFEYALSSAPRVSRGTVPRDRFWERMSRRRGGKSWRRFVDCCSQLFRSSGSA